MSDVKFIRKNGRIIPIKSSGSRSEKKPPSIIKPTTTGAKIGVLAGAAIGTFASVATGLAGGVGAIGLGLAGERKAAIATTAITALGVGVIGSAYTIRKAVKFGLYGAGAGAVYGVGRRLATKDKK